MKYIACEDDWPESWRLSHRFDLEEVWGRISNRGYAYAYDTRRQQTLALMQGVLQPGARVLDIAAAQGKVQSPCTRVAKELGAGRAAVVDRPHSRMVDQRNDG